MREGFVTFVQGILKFNCFGPWWADGSSPRTPTIDKNKNKGHSRSRLNFLTPGCPSVQGMPKIDKGHSRLSLLIYINHFNLNLFYFSFDIFSDSFLESWFEY